MPNSPRQTPFVGLRHAQTNLQVFAFAITSLNDLILTPIQCQNSVRDVAVKRRIRPFHRARYVTMLAGIPMNVVHVPRKIVIVPNQMFPITSLPDTPLSLGNTAGIDPLTWRQAARNPRLDQRPAAGIIHIPVGQGPQGVEVVGQDHDGIDGKGVTFPHTAHHSAQNVHVFNQQATPPIDQIDREEIGGTRHMGTTVEHRSFTPKRGLGRRLG